MKRLGLYGGTFDPPHLGHVRAASFFCREAELDCLIILPNGRPPLKEAPDVTPAHRFAMCIRAFAEVPKATVSDYEIRAGGTSYTWLTVRHYRTLYPQAEIFFLLGTDQFLQLDKWKNTAYLFANVTFIVVPRDSRRAELRAKAEELLACGAKIRLLETDETVVSSSAIRAGNEREFLQPSVRNYIEEHHLYEC